MLSTIFSGSKVRVLVNNGREPETGEIVTLSSPSKSSVFPLSQVTSMSAVIETSVSVVGLMEMVQVRVRGVVLPANSGPGGTVMSTSGVETGRNKKSLYSHKAQEQYCLPTLHIVFYHSRRR